jgi:endonuclease/exonuclease/phosphatase family metal-dependent hydrolase
MRVATWNIHACIGSDGRFDPGRTAKVLRELEADVIALQEVEHHAVEGEDILDYLADAVGLQALAGPTLRRRSNNDYGNALLSRLPIRAVDRVDLSEDRREPRGAIHALLDWNGLDIQVVATHLGLSPVERRRQVRKLLVLLEARPVAAAILMGDLNEWLLWGRPLRWLRTHFAPMPHRRTWPSRLPLLALDRIWVEPRAAVTALGAHRSPLAAIASDHLPLVADLRADTASPDSVWEPAPHRVSLGETGA